MMLKHDSKILVEADVLEEASSGGEATLVQPYFPHYTCFPTVWILLAAMEPEFRNQPYFSRGGAGACRHYSKRVSPTA